MPRYPTILEWKALLCPAQIFLEWRISFNPAQSVLSQASLMVVATHESRLGMPMMSPVLKKLEAVVKKLKSATLQDSADK